MDESRRKTVATRVNLSMALLQCHVAHGDAGKMVCVNIHKI